jgi:hypothetical protein
VHIFNVDFLTNKLFYKKGLKKIGAANWQWIDLNIPADKKTSYQQFVVHLMEYFLQETGKKGKYIFQLKTYISKSYNSIKNWNLNKNLLLAACLIQLKNLSWSRTNFVTFFEVCNFDLISKSETKF